MKRVDPELKFFKMQIVSLFHNEIIFRANKYQQFCWLGNDEQVIKTKIRVRGLMVSEFVCPWNGKMVDPDTGEPCCMILNYGKNYDGYWTGKYVVIQLQDTHTTFINLHPGCITLYVFNN